MEPFFHFPAGFEDMDVAVMAEHLKRIEPFNQCRIRNRDDQWPTVEPHLRRDIDTKTMLT